jgi:tRNA-specific adenosine deaminase 1
MPPNGEDIANVVLTQFARLPKKRKPLTRENSVKEWVPLAGIVGESTWLTSSRPLFYADLVI